MNAEERDLVPFENLDEPPELEHSVQYLAAVKATLPPEDYCEFIHIMDTYRKQGLGYEWVRDNVKEFLKDYRFLTRAFNVFLPKAHRIKVPPAKCVSVDLPTACRFLHKIKRCTTGSNEILDSFLHIIQKVGNNGKLVIEIYREVAFLLNNDPYLLEEFTQFLPGSLKPTANVSSSSDWKSLIQLMSSAVEETKELPESVWSTEMLMICNKVKQQLNQRDYEKFLDCLKDYNNGRLSSQDLQYLVGNLLVHNPALIEEFNDFTAAECLAKCKKSRIKRGKNGRFIREGPCRDDMPYVNPEASNKSEVDKEVLNCRWVSVGSGRENFSDFPEVHNPYADKLFKCEDEMYEMDLLLRNGGSVIARIKILMKKLNGPSGNIKIPIRLEEHFRAMNIRCILQVYGDIGYRVLEALKEDPRRSLPVILDRMKKHREDWIDQRNQYSKIWSKVKQENYHKSLDPQGFNKKQDGNKRNSRAIVAGSKACADQNYVLAVNAIEQKIPHSAIRTKKKCLWSEASSARSIVTKRLDSEEDLEARVSAKTVKKWARRTFFNV